MATDVTLPELGENIEAGDVAAVLVSPGDRVEKDAPLLELETDKAVVEVPSPEAGVVTAVLVKAGDTINVGDPIASLEPDGAGAAPQPEAPPAAQAGPSAEQPLPAAGPAPAPAQAAGSLLAAASGVTAFPSAGAAPAAPEAAKPEPPPAPGPSAAPEPPAAPAPTAAPAGVPAPEAVQPIPATPAVRRLAREIGVDITAVTGTGEGGRILLDDVKAAAKRLLQAPSPAAAHPAARHCPTSRSGGRSRSRR